jgi:hypothetical protein
VHPPHAYPVPPFALSPQPLYLYLPRHADTAAATTAHLVILIVTIAIALTSAQCGRREVVAAIVTISIAIDIALVSAEWCRRVLNLTFCDSRIFIWS